VLLHPLDQLRRHAYPIPGLTVWCDGCVCVHRHPHENSYEDFPLPQNELPMFCFPRGIHLKVRHCIH
jgi:hypothetical protein